MVVYLVCGVLVQFPEQTVKGVIETPNAQVGGTVHEREESSLAVARLVQAVGVEQHSGGFGHVTGHTAEAGEVAWTPDTDRVRGTANALTRADPHRPNNKTLGILALTV